MFITRQLSGDGIETGLAMVILSRLNMAKDGSGSVILPRITWPDQTTNGQQTWELFFAWSVIASRHGSATCFQMLVVKNLNCNHRINGVPSQYGLSAALLASKAAGRAQLVE